ncbi:MAG: SH3 domain-containing protein [Bacteroidota bacterium]
MILVSCRDNKSDVSDAELETVNASDSIQNKQLDSSPKVDSSDQDIRSCDFTTYVIYRDSLPLYKEPGGEAVLYFRFEDDPEYDFGGGFNFKNSENGYLQINKDEDYPNLEHYWVKSNNIEIGVVSYSESQIVSLYEYPDDKSKSVMTINSGKKLNVFGCQDKWVLVENNGEKGWLAPEDQCNNPVTTCG